MLSSVSLSVKTASYHMYSMQLLQYVLRAVQLVKLYATTLRISLDGRAQNNTALPTSMAMQVAFTHDVYVELQQGSPRRQPISASFGTGEIQCKRT